MTKKTTRVKSDPKTKENLRNPNALAVFSDEYLDLCENMRRAIDMRLDGYHLQDIAKSLNLAYGTIMWYFTKSGPCWAAYDKMRFLRALDRRDLMDQIHAQLQDIALDAVQVIKEAVRNKAVPANIKVPAAFKALETIGYQPLVAPGGEERPAISITFNQFDDVKAKSKPKSKPNSIKKAN